MITKQQEQKFALCLKNDNCEDLEVRKIYRIIPDEGASRDGYLRIIDESGEDYLYPESYFVFVKLPRKAQELVMAAAI
jgi:hypothetical protein